MDRTDEKVWETIHELEAAVAKLRKAMEESDLEDDTSNSPDKG